MERCPNKKCENADIQLVSSERDAWSFFCPSCGHQGPIGRNAAEAIWLWEALPRDFGADAPGGPILAIYERYGRGYTANFPTFEAARAFLVGDEEGYDCAPKFVIDSQSEEVLWSSNNGDLSNAHISGPEDRGNQFGKGYQKALKDLMRIEVFDPCQADYYPGWPYPPRRNTAALVADRAVILAEAVKSGDENKIREAIKGVVALAEIWGETGRGC